jgi:hypothetical protein
MAGHGMIDWLRKFLYSDDEPVIAARGMLEPEAELWRQMLEQNGVPAFTKIMDAVALSDGHATGTDCALYVKQSDLQRARELLAARSRRHIVRQHRIPRLRR